jgi:ribose/xylose/arabinose/galactoside ABC-type transport system permease subunit
VDSNFLREFGRTAGLIGTIVLVMAIFAIASDGRFLQPENLLGLLRYMSTLAIVGLGLTVVLIVGEIDLSFGAVYGFSAMITAVAWINWGWSVGAAIGLALLCAIAVGLFNGFFTTVAKIPSFIATLGASTLVFGFTLFVSGSATYSPMSPGPGRTMNEEQVEFFRGLSNQDLPLGLPMGALWMAAIALAFWYIISKSLFGFRLKAIGGNAVAAQFARIPVRRYKMWAFVICALAAAVAAILTFAFIGSVQPDSGAGLLFPTFAAVVIGGASLSGGRGTVLGTLLGCLLLAILNNGLALLAAGAFLQQIFIGVVTIGAVVLDQATQRWRKDR